MRIFLFSILFVFISLKVSGQDKSMINGMSLESPPRQFVETELEPIKDLGANWVAVIPYGFSTKGDPKVYYNSPRQWWGERPDGAKEMIEMAHNQNLRVMLKPQIWMPNTWVGEFTFSEEQDWLIWENSYREYILTFAQIAQEQNVELFCVGTEYRLASKLREEFWRDLISAVREIYSGKLTYAANWDEYDSVPFWDDLDYIGIDAYFPLSTSGIPKVDELNKAWLPIKRKIQKFSQQTQLPVLFTEYGYRSVEHNANNQWEIKDNNVSMLSQLRAFESLYDSFWDEPFFHGGFIWKWHLKEGAGGENNRDYTPQGKAALEIIKYTYHSTR